MIILMKSDKSLVISVNTRMYQRENVVDKLTFYIPATYQDIDLTPFTNTLYYVTQTNDAYTEILVLQEETEKEGYLTYKLPVSTKFTKSAGKISLHLSMTYLDETTDPPTQYVLHTGELKDIEILSWDDYYKFIPDDSLATLDQKILELQNETEKLKAISDELEMKVPDDLTLDADMLHLSHEGEMLGQGVEVVIPGDPDDEDESHDGVIDLDDLPENSEGGEGEDNEDNGLNLTDTDSEQNPASYYYIEL